MADKIVPAGCAAQASGSVAAPAANEAHAARLVIAVAPDSFKGALSAGGVAKAVADGFARVFPDAEFRLIPMADGGEGTVEAWAESRDAEIITLSVRDPLMRPVSACFAYDSKDATAVIEMAAADGLPLLKTEERNPLVTTTYGTGEMILRALDLGARHIILGIGGSATNDGGAGMAAALGARFIDGSGRELPQGGAALADLASIDISGMDKRLASVEFEVACDVVNPLCGKEGASAVYGPQKGASAQDVERLDAALRHYAEIAVKCGIAGADDAVKAGAGAAGGLGFGLSVFCGAKLRRGVRIIADSVSLARKLEGCSLVITGEGRMDSQTVNGKTPAGVAEVARAAGVPCIAICGCVGAGYEAVHAAGIEAVVPVAHGFFDPADPSRGAVERITACAEETARLMALRFSGPVRK